jgi:hypothetical protein
VGNIYLSVVYLPRWFIPCKVGVSSPWLDHRTIGIKVQTISSNKNNCFSPEVASTNLSCLKIMSNLFLAVVCSFWICYTRQVSKKLLKKCWQSIIFQPR